LPSSDYVRTEYAAMMQRAVEGKQRLLPVLLKDAELPPFLATRIHVDFRDADGPDYRARVTELIHRLKNEPIGPPRRRTGELNLPPDSIYAIAGPRSVLLSIGRGPHDPLRRHRYLRPAAASRSRCHRPQLATGAGAGRSEADP
jgi:hypothetical protein